MGKFLTIPKGEENPYLKLLLAWHTGIDAIEAKDCFILNEEAFNILNNFPKIITIDNKDVLVKDALRVYPLKDEKDIVFNITEETIEP